MRHLSILALLLFLLSGCRGGGKSYSIVGDWVAGNSHLVHAFAPNGEYELMDSGEPYATGRYTLSGNTLSIDLGGSQGQITTYDVEWISDDEFMLTIKSQKSKADRVTKVLKSDALGSTYRMRRSSGFAATTSPVEQKQSCQRNLQAIWKALSLYSSDNDGYLPGANWQDLIEPYVEYRNALRCPSLQEKNKEGGYVFNADLIGRRREDIPDFLSQIVVFEGAAEHRNAVGQYEVAVNRHQNGLVLGGNGQVGSAP